MPCLRTALPTSAFRQLPHVPDDATPRRKRLRDPWDSPARTFKLDDAHTVPCLLKQFGSYAAYVRGATSAPAYRAAARNWQ